MSTTVKSAFRPTLVSLKIDSLLPSRPIHPRHRVHEKYKQIAASIKSVGVIEPVVVFPNRNGKYRVLDGHKRLDILLRNGVPEVECLIASDDEAYTYNRRVNYLSPVSEHQMILRALEHNTEARIATALNVNISTIRRKRQLLNGICKEAIELLKDHRVTPKAFTNLRKMKPVRQIEAAQLMIASNMYTGTFAAALVAGSRPEMLLSPDRDAHPASAPGDQKLRMEQETDELLRNVRAVEETYGSEVLTLSVCCRYITTLLANGTIHDYLKKEHRDILREFETVIAATNTPESDGAVGAVALSKAN